MLVLGHHHGLALALRDGDRRDVFGQPRLRRRGPLLAAQRVRVLRRALDAEFFSDVLGGFGHRVDAVLLRHALVHESPADRGVVDLGVAAVGGLGLGHHEGGAAHAFHAAGNDQVGRAAFHRARGVDHGVHPAGAEAVQGDARHAFRQARKQRRHPCDVAIVLAGLVGAAHDHLVRLDRAAIEGGGDGMCGQVVGPHRSQRAAISADRSALAGTDVGGTCHVASFRPVAAEPSAFARRIRPLVRVSGIAPFVSSLKLHA